jgi:hypothetical protein
VITAGVVSSLSTRSKRIWGSVGVALAFGVFAAVQASKAHHGALWLTLVSAGIIAVLTGVSFWSYWTFAPRVGKATTLAALSVAWGVLLLVVGWLSTSAAESGSGNLAGYAITGGLIPWLVALITVPFAWIVRGANRLVTYWNNRAARDPATSRFSSKHGQSGNNRSASTVKSSNKRVSTARHNGRYTAPKASSGR